MLGSLRETSGETCRRGDGGRSQRLRSTARQPGSQAGQGQAEGNRSPSAGEQTLPKARNGRWKSTESKVVPREERQEGGDVKDRTSDSESAVMAVPEAAKQITSEAAGKRA